jgi:drug/metabolite transporter (DMT)-like permease
LFNTFILTLVTIGSVFGAVGMLLLKKTANKYQVWQMHKSGLLWLGLTFVGVSTILYIVALQRERLSVLYPLVSMTYLWTTFLSVKYLGEKMNKWKWFGLIGVILGIVLIGIGS